MMSGEDIKILQDHLNELIIKSEGEGKTVEGDKTINALRRLLDFVSYEKDTLWISSKSDLLIAIQQGELNVFENGTKIENIDNLSFNYNRGETSAIKIKQFI